jgi:hypothetical protein
VSAARIAVLAAALASLPAAARAGAVGPLTTFTAGTPARAAEVNGNFGAVRTAVDDNAAKIAALTATIQAMQAQLQAHEDAFINIGDFITNLNLGLTTVQNEEVVQSNAIGALTNTVDAQAETIRSLSARLAAAEAQAAAVPALIARLATAEAEVVAARDGVSAIQASPVMALAPYVSVFPLPAPLIRFSGANLQVVNGRGFTQTANGLGNLIVGYDEGVAGAPTCSLGFFVDEASCLANGGTWATGHKSGSHNVVIGPFHSYSQFGGLVAGAQNTISGEFATVTGGLDNAATVYAASVSGGQFNRAANFAASVSGGNGNAATNQYASVSGGSSNTASGAQSSVCGGTLNQATGFTATVSGGRENQATSGAAAVCGGQFNVASGSAASVSGGARNLASQTWASVTGGTDNAATAQAASASGGVNNLVEVPFGVAVGGAFNRVSGLYSVVVGGGDGTAAGGNRANASYTSVLGGVTQAASTPGQTIPALP